jgi:hypothetical protein
MTDTPPSQGNSRSPSHSRFGPLLAALQRYLSQALLELPALFEIRNIRTGETARQYAPFNDGTLADRAARTLGQDWRVFRLNPEASETNNSNLPATTRQDQECTTKDLGALYDALQRPAVFETPDPFSTLPHNIHLEPGQLTVTFSNAIELRETLASLSTALSNYPMPSARTSRRLP